MRPIFRDVTVGTDRADTGAVHVVDCALVFLIHKIFHFMTGYAEFFAVGGFHGGVETTPENNAGHKDA